MFKDAIAEDWSKEKTLEFAKNYDLIVMETSVPSVKNDFEFARQLTSQGKIVIMVGNRLEYYFEKYIEREFIIYGEWEIPTTNFINQLHKNGGPQNLDLESIKGLIYRTDFYGGTPNMEYEGKKIRKNEKEKYIENLDEIPWVSKVYKKYLPIEKYFYASLQHPMMTILTARGCPYNCSLCQIPFKNSYRMRSVDDVLNELEWIEKNAPEVKEIMIEDDTFDVLPSRTKEFCEKKIERGIKLKFSANLRVNTTYENMILMKKAGLRLACVGFESPSQNILNNIHKGTTKDLQINFMKNAKKAKLLVNGCFILGLPGDTKETMEKTIEFAKQLAPDTAQFYPLMVYPGTEDYERAKRENKLVTENYEEWITKEGYHTTTIKTKDLTREELLEMCDKARASFYFRPSYIAYKLWQSIKNPAEMKRNVKAASTLVSYFIYKIFHKPYKEKGENGNTARKRE